MTALFLFRVWLLALATTTTFAVDLDGRPVTSWRPPDRGPSSSSSPPRIALSPIAMSPRCND